MTPRRDDPEHDAWLREALRHAPDADIAAPQAVSDTILRQARAATAARAAPVASPRQAAPHGGLLEQLTSFWAWLARPSVATGFASVMVATVVGMLWWGRPMDEAAMPPPMPAAAERMPQAPTPTAASAPVDAPVPAPVQEDERESNEARVYSPVDDGAAKQASPPRLQQRARVTVPASAAGAMREADRDSEEQRRSIELRADALEKREAAGAAAAAKAAPAESMEAAPSPAKRTDAPTIAAQADAAPSRSTAPVAAANPAAVTAAAPAHNDDAQVREFVQDERAAPSPAPRIARAKAAAVAGAGAAGLSAAPEVSNAARATTSAATALSDLRQAIAAEPERWSWQRGGSAAHAMTPALQIWLSGLGDGSASEAPRRSDTTSPRLRLLRDGRLHSTVVLGGDHLQLLPADTVRSALQWPLTPEAAAALRDALDTATR